MEYGRFGSTNLVIVVSFAVSFKDGGFVSDSVLETGTLDLFVCTGTVCC